MSIKIPYGVVTNASRLLPLFLGSMLYLGCSKPHVPIQPGPPVKETQHSKRVSLTGQVFIVTKGRENIKLGLVEVKAYPSDAFCLTQISEKLGVIEQYKTLVGKKDNLVEKRASKEEIDRWHFGIVQNFADTVVDNLDKEEARSLTDGDGKFILSLSGTGDYVVVARASRKLPDKEEKYIWIVEQKVDSEPVTLLLSNHNLTDPVKFYYDAGLP